MPASISLVVVSTADLNQLFLTKDGPKCHGSCNAGPAELWVKVGSRYHNLLTGRWIGTRSLKLWPLNVGSNTSRIAPTSGDEVSTKYTNTTPLSWGYDGRTWRSWWRWPGIPGGWLLGWGCVGDAVYGAMGPSMQVCQGLEEPWVVPPQMEGADMMGWWSFCRELQGVHHGKLGMFFEMFGIVGWSTYDINLHLFRWISSNIIHTSS